jgi:hypothetical protein
MAMLINEERDALKKQVEQLTWELAAWQALEMNHEGACVRLKKERDAFAEDCRALADIKKAAEEWSQVDSYTVNGDTEFEENHTETVRRVTKSILNGKGPKT